MPFPGEFEFVSPPDPFVVPYPGELEPITSVFITSRNQPPPPVLATRVFPPPLWPLPPHDQTIMPVVGPIMALTPKQVDTPPGFGLSVFGAEGIDPGMATRMEQREAVRREEHHEHRERREERRRRRNGDRERLPGDAGERPAE